MAESVNRRILNQIKCDFIFEISDFEITVLHRGAPNTLKTYPADRIKAIKISPLVFEDELMEEVVIPFHRIRKIYDRKLNEILWEQDSGTNHEKSIF